MVSVVAAVSCNILVAHHMRDELAHAIWLPFGDEVVYSPLTLRRHIEKDESIVHIYKIADTVRSLSMEQRVAQLFFVTPESLLQGRYKRTVTAAGERTRAALQEKPVGGIIYFEANLKDAKQAREMLTKTSDYALESCGVPILLGLDEEGGTVSRIGGNKGFDIKNVGNMSKVGKTKSTERAKDVATNMGSYLHKLGFNANLAPVADIANNPKSKVMAKRSFGSDSVLVSQMVAAQVVGFRSQRIICCAKHFPGIGGAVGDSHDGAIFTHRTAGEMTGEELLPFMSAIKSGVPMVMVGHISCPEITGNDLPASVSPQIMQGLLRDRMGFDGVIITDSLSMGAIAKMYGKDRVAVEAFKAGADALLMPPDFNAAYRGMLDAVKSGEISERRLTHSVWRIVQMKLENEWY
jgi:beta-N-acetylhexosaminidase